MTDIINQISVDIVLPNYNSSPYIEETLNSIINQNFKNWNLLIVDDNSDDKTKYILKKYDSNNKIKIIWLKKNKGAGFCRNLAIRNSKSQYIAFIDSDDIWEKEKLSKQLTFMIKNQYYFTYTNYRSFQSDNEKNNFKNIKPPKRFTFKKIYSRYFNCYKHSDIKKIYNWKYKIYQYKKFVKIIFLNAKF